MLAATVVGNLGQNAELGDAEGTPVVNFSVASNSKIKGNDHTTWIRCAFFGKRAESVAEYLTKGKQVAVRGGLILREYESKNGSGTSLDMRVDDLQLLGGGSKSDENDEPPKGKANGNGKGKPANGKGKR